MPITGSDFFQKFPDLVKEITTERLDRGLAVAGMQLLRDSAEEVVGEEGGRTPLKEGFLRGSGSVHVQGRETGNSRDSPGAKGGETAHSVSDVTQHNANQHEAIVAFNTPYAARLHEHPEYTFSRADEGFGGKFLESKMVAFKDDYMAVIAEELKK